MNARCPKDAEGAPEAVSHDGGPGRRPVTCGQCGDAEDRGEWEDE
jgi:hypothetical protein